MLLDTAACEGGSILLVAKQRSLTFRSSSCLIEDSGSLVRNPSGIIVIVSSLTVMEHPLKVGLGQVADQKLLSEIGSLPLGHGHPSLYGKRMCQVTFGNNLSIDVENNSPFLTV